MPGIASILFGNWLQGREGPLEEVLKEKHIAPLSMI